MKLRNACAAGTAFLGAVYFLGRRGTRHAERLTSLRPSGEGTAIPITILNHSHPRLRSLPR